MIFLLLLLSIFLNQISSSLVSEPVSFSFHAFNESSCTNDNLICTGDVTAENGYLSLTSASSKSTGRVLYNQPVLAWPATISTTFGIQIEPYANTTGSADGLTFVFAPDSNPSPKDSYGEYLGIISAAGGTVSQLAVELDTFKNGFDIDGNHVGIDTTSVISLAAESFNSTGIDLKSGRLINVQIDYDGWTKMIYVSASYDGDSLQIVLEESIIMSETVPSSVYVGFTAATGLFKEKHRVLDWSFTTIPLPSSSLENRKLINEI